MHGAGPELDTLICRWAERDFAATLAWAKGLQEPHLQERMLVHLGYRWLARSPQEALAYAVARPSPTGQFLQTLMSQWARSEPEAAAAWLEKADIGPERGRLRQAVLAVWAETAPELVAAFAAERTHAAERAEAIATAASAWARQEPERAAAWAQRLNDSELRARAYPTIVVAWTKRGASAAGQWIESLPPGLDRDAAVAAFSGWVARTDPDLGFGVAEGIGEAAMREAQLEAVARRWMAVDRMAALDALRRTRLPAAVRERVERSPW